MHQQAVVLAVWLTAACVVIGLIAACGDKARREWRKHAIADVAPGSWVVSDPWLAVAVQSALSTLAALSPPPVHTLVVGDSRVIARFSHPATHPPSAPWKLVADGQLGGSWAADIADLNSQHATPLGMSAFVPVGTVDDATVLVDLLAAPGMISVRGDQQAVCRIVSAMAFELISNPWSRRARLALIGFDGDVPVPEPGRVHAVRSLESLDAEVPGEPGDVLVPVLAHPPQGDDIDRVRSLLGGDDRAVTAICVGPSCLAGWVWDLVDDSLAMPALGLRVQPMVAEVEQRQRRLLDLGAAVGLKPGNPEPDVEPEHLTSQPAFVPPEPMSDGIDIAGAGDQSGLQEVHDAPEPELGKGATPGALLPQAWLDTIRVIREPVVTGAQRARLWPAVAEVRLVGPLEVTALGTDLTGQEPAIAELILASLHPDGLPTDMLARALPTPPPEPVAGAHLWLNIGQSRLPLVCEATGGWRIPADVLVDWQLFRALVETPEPATELIRCHSALALIRGPLDAGDHLADHARHVLWNLTSGAEAMIVRTVRRAAMLAAKRRDSGLIEWTLRQGLVALPRIEGLWRSLLLFHHEHDRGKVPGTVDEMLAALSAPTGHARLAPETSALLSRLERDRELWRAR